MKKGSSGGLRQDEPSHAAMSDVQEAHEHTIQLPEAGTLICIKGGLRRLRQSLFRPMPS
jgi:hypothetical protein